MEVAMEKGARSYLGQVFAVGGTQVSAGGMQVRRGQDASRPRARHGRVPKLSSPPSRSLFQAMIGSAM